jgi:hypothetical protein
VVVGNGWTVCGKGVEGSNLDICLLEEVVTTELGHTIGVGPSLIIACAKVNAAYTARNKK